MALKLFARTLRQNLRPDDIAARYGGEEFVLVLPNTSVDEAKRAIDRLRSCTRRRDRCSRWRAVHGELGSHLLLGCDFLRRDDQDRRRGLSTQPREPGETGVVVAGAEPRLTDEASTMAEVPHEGGHPVRGVETFPGDGLSGESGTSVSLEVGGPSTSAERAAGQGRGSCGVSAVRVLQSLGGRASVSSVGSASINSDFSATKGNGAVPRVLSVISLPRLLPGALPGHLDLSEPPPPGSDSCLPRR
ncbi:MAG: hypothetical protein KatS3mg008_1146 [Acidimicrobiales bacterium]|nr:MAG: hypothetical protein KatS3mg008_1146 [Acidimicrobiales bacterium]